jgi:HK97 gp10 family phage protein
VNIDIDVTELLDLAGDLENIAPKQMRNAMRAVTKAETAQVLSRARAGAPKDRPWLAGPGLRKSMRTYGDAVVGSVYSPPDPEGRPVAVFVVYGTSKMAPQDFITPAMSPSEATYPPAILAAIEPLATSAGPEVGDEGG